MIAFSHPCAVDCALKLNKLWMGFFLVYGKFWFKEFIDFDYDVQYLVGCPGFWLTDMDESASRLSRCNFLPGVLCRCC